MTNGPFGIIWVVDDSRSCTGRAHTIYRMPCSFLAGWDLPQGVGASHAASTPHRPMHLPSENPSNKQYMQALHKQQDALQMTTAARSSLLLGATFCRCCKTRCLYPIPCPLVTCVNLSLHSKINMGHCELGEGSCW